MGEVNTVSESLTTVTACQVVLAVSCQDWLGSGEPLDGSRRSSVSNSSTRARFALGLFGREKQFESLRNNHFAQIVTPVFLNICI